MFFKPSKGEGSRWCHFSWFINFRSDTDDASLNLSSRCKLFYTRWVEKCINQMQVDLVYCCYNIYNHLVCQTFCHWDHRVHHDVNYNLIKSVCRSGTVTNSAIHNERLIWAYYTHNGSTYEEQQNTAFTSLRIKCQQITWTCIN